MSDVKRVRVSLQSYNEVQGDGSPPVHLSDQHRTHCEDPDPYHTHTHTHADSTRLYFSVKNQAPLEENGGSLIRQRVLKSSAFTFL